MKDLNIWEWIYSYFIIYHGQYEMNYQPIIFLKSKKDIPDGYQKSMHLMDFSIVRAFPILEYVLHLPRITLDLYHLDVDVIEKSHDTSHNIWLLPDSLFLKMNLHPMHPTGIFLEDECLPETMEHGKNMKSILGVHWGKDLDEILLKEHWRILRDREDHGGEKLLDVDQQPLLHGKFLKSLPQGNLSRQIGQWENILFRMKKTKNIEMECFQVQKVHNSHVQALMNFFAKGNTDIVKEKYDEEWKKVYSQTSPQVIITYPGIPPIQEKYGKRSQQLPKEEKQCIRILGVHRAIAKDGVLLELPSVSPELFRELNELEHFCKENGVNGGKIRRSLRKIGKIFNQQMTEEQRFIIAHAKSITAFTDFPLGLAVMEDGIDPLLCFKNISYHPLTPLTRCLMVEIGKHRQIYFGARCRVGFLECIPKTKENCYVRGISDQTVFELKKLSKEYENFQVVYREAMNVSSLHSSLKNMGSIDILYISAHGFYDPRHNVSGLYIGEERWLGNENDLHVPPVVFLSACHTAPRGAGAVNSADLFLRMGAEAVLCSFIPINAHRNMILMIRLFTYILEAQKGNKQYKTLADAWTGVVATNAIHELIHDAPRLKHWMHDKGPNGIPRIIDFQLSRSVGRLRLGTTYGDTIALLKEMLREEGMEGKFDDVLSGNNYFPESFFYQLIGYPENIFLYNDVFAAYLGTETK